MAETGRLAAETGTVKVDGVEFMLGPEVEVSPKPTRRRKGAIDKMAERLAKEIGAMSNQRLMRLRYSIQSMSTTNCGWFAHALSQPISEYVENELRRRGA